MKPIKQIKLMKHFYSIAALRRLRRWRGLPVLLVLLPKVKSLIASATARALIFLWPRA
jgi:hypothetical protein